MTFNRQQRSIEEAAIQVTVLLLLNFVLQVLSTLSSMETQPCTYFTINSIKENFYDLQTESHEKALGQVNERIITVREKKWHFEIRFCNNSNKNCGI